MKSILLTGSSGFVGSRLLVALERLGYSINLLSRSNNKLFPTSVCDFSSSDIPSNSLNSIDTVLITYTLCTIPEVEIAIKEMRRVLRPEGELIFCEHGKSPDENIVKWQNKINPYWNVIGGGCNINRDIPRLIESAGFLIKSLESMYIPGTPKIFGFNYWGKAIQL
jgi:SAM-dependent methyltransferase